MIVFWGTITVENLLGFEGFLGTPKKEKKEKNQVAFKIQKSPRREELAKKKKRSSRILLGCSQNSHITKR